MKNGDVSEWFMEPVLKTGDSIRAVGSNPTVAANAAKRSSSLRCVVFPFFLFTMSV